MHKYIWAFCLCVCTHMWAYVHEQVHACYGILLEVRGQPIGTSQFFPSTMWFQERNSCSRPWWQLPFLAEPSHWLNSIFIFGSLVHILAITIMAIKCLDWHPAEFSEKWCYGKWRDRKKKERSKHIKTEQNSLLGTHSLSNLLTLPLWCHPHSFLLHLCDFHADPQMVLAFSNIRPNPHSISHVAIALYPSEAVSSAFQLDGCQPSLAPYCCCCVGVAVSWAWHEMGCCESVPGEETNELSIASQASKSCLPAQPTVFSCSYLQNFKVGAFKTNLQEQRDQRQY